ncbi:MAG: hypothetical protein KGI38_12335 [Thaumarchaeota archaeon]|nr:hypothetical protein [Nitrososphaerota archaeon]
MSNCPDCNSLMSPCHVKVEMGWAFDGFLCGKCRKIWASTKVDDSIDLRLLA